MRSIAGAKGKAGLSKYPLASKRLRRRSSRLSAVSVSIFNPTRFKAELANALNFVVNAKCEVLMDVGNMSIQRALALAASV